MKKLLILLLISFAICSCSHNAPKRPKIEPVYGALITNDRPYIYYQYLNNSKVKWRIPLSPDISGQHTCTPTKDFVEWYAYGKQVEEYVLKLEEEIARMKIQQEQYCK